MDLCRAFSSQYLAALAMLEQVVTRCPPELWEDGEEDSRFWHIAYHSLFFTHLYLQESKAAFKPWSKHRHEYEALGMVRWPSPHKPEIGEPYTQAEVLEFLASCRDLVFHQLPATDFAAPSGFDWLPFDKVELQVYNLRHLHQHIGELGGRLAAHGIETDWISVQPT
jgi:hypothetical protein